MRKLTEKEWMKLTKVYLLIFFAYLIGREAYEYIICYF